MSSDDGRPTPMISEDLEALLEQAFWRFDALHKTNYRDVAPGREGPMSEREAFKWTARQLLDPRPVPMLLTCPSCGERHIDEGDFASKAHHTHACQSCGMCWRPAIVPTVGVQFLPGFKNKEPRR